MLRFRIPSLLLLVSLFFLGINTLRAQGPVLTCIPERIEMGSIALDTLSDAHGKHTITVRNDGDKPLILQKVTGCCGTEIPDFTKGPILPGKEGKIEVAFRIEPKPQSISRTVTIVSNAGGEVKVPIIGSVILPKKKGQL